MSRWMKTAIKLGVIVICGVLLLRWNKSPWFHSLFDVSLGLKLSFGVWLIFTLYWSISARNSAPARSGESSWSRQIHLILVNGALVLLFLPIPGLTHRLLPANSLVTGVGLTIEAAFVLFAIWARRHLGRNWSGEVRIAAGHTLVRSGPYRFVRHPIYTGVLGMYLGTAVVSGEIHAILALLIVVLAYVRKIRLEERVLTDVFGGTYGSYQNDTWAIVPLLF